MLILPIEPIETLFAQEQKLDSNFPKLGKLLQSGGVFEEAIRPVLAATCEDDLRWSLLEQVEVVDLETLIGLLKNDESKDIVKVENLVPGTSGFQHQLNAQIRATIYLTIYRRWRSLSPKNGFAGQAPPARQITNNLDHPLLRNLYREVLAGNLATLATRVAAHLEPKLASWKIDALYAAQDRGAYAALRLLTSLPGVQVPLEIVPLNDRIDVEKLNEQSEKFSVWLASERERAAEAEAPVEGVYCAH